MANKVKVTMLRDSWKTSAGDNREVESALADQLVANGHAVRSSQASASKAATAKG